MKTKQELMEEAKKAVKDAKREKEMAIRHSEFTRSILQESNNLKNENDLLSMQNVNLTQECMNLQEKMDQTKKLVVDLQEQNETILHELKRYSNIISLQDKIIAKQSSLINNIL